MRIRLQPLEGLRTLFYAEYGGQGFYITKYGRRRKVFLINLRDSQYRELADHISTSEPRAVENLSLMKRGDLVQFVGTVRRYRKGYCGDDVEKKLNKPMTFDYEIYGISDMRRITIDTAKGSMTNPPSFDELMRKKRIVLGVH